MKKKVTDEAIRRMFQRLQAEGAKRTDKALARFKASLAEAEAQEKHTPVFVSGLEQPRTEISLEPDATKQQVFADAPKDKPYFVKPGNPLADAAKKFYEDDQEMPPPRHSEHRRPRPEKK